MDIQVGDKITYKYLNNNDNKIYTSIIEDIGDLKTYERMIESRIEIGSIEILKIERPKYEVVEERKELLTEEEREFLKQYIKIIESLNNGQVTSIRKQSSWIILKLKTELEYQADIGPKFKNLEDCKTYTLKELGLEEN